MTNKQFFLKLIEEETPITKTVLEAIPADKHEYKIHERSRTVHSLASQLSMQWKAIAEIISKGAPNFDPHAAPDAKDWVKSLDAGQELIKKAIEAVSEQEWETGEANMMDMWKTDKMTMAWGFLFDAIHHRGQLSSFLRAMGAKVPSIYGGSADAQPGQ